MEKEELEEIALVGLDDWMEGEDAGVVLDPVDDDDDDDDDDSFDALSFSVGFGCRGS